MTNKTMEKFTWMKSIMKTAWAELRFVWRAKGRYWSLQPKRSGGRTTLPIFILLLSKLSALRSRTQKTHDRCSWNGPYTWQVWWCRNEHRFLYFPIWRLTLFPWERSIGNQKGKIVVRLERAGPRCLFISPQLPIGSENWVLPIYLSSSLHPQAGKLKAPIVRAPSVPSV